MPPRPLSTDAINHASKLPFVVFLWLKKQEGKHTGAAFKLMSTDSVNTEPEFLNF
jgi:hypothetical protein